MTNTVKVITHYYKDDVNYTGDYDSVEIQINNTPVVLFGDSYHDKGKEKAQGFIEACLYFMPDEVLVQ